MAQGVPKHKALEIPEFSAALPSFIVDTLDGKERYMLEAISKIEQQNNWMCQILVENDSRVRAVEQMAEECRRALAEHEKKELVLSGKRAVIGGAGLIGFTAVISETIRWFIGVFRNLT